MPRRPSLPPTAPIVGQAFPKPASAARGTGKEPRPVRPKRESIWGTGSRHLRLGAEPARYGGPGQPPPDWASAQTTYPEWVAFYWFWIVLVGSPDAYGGVRAPQNRSGPPDRSFSYQKFLPDARVSGSTNIDFIINTDALGSFLVRLMGERFHTHAGSQQIQLDIDQAFRVTGPEAVVIDIWEQHLLTDTERWNGAAHRVCRDATQGVAWQNPITAGTTMRVRV